MIVPVAGAEDWIDLVKRGHGTKVGAGYAVLCQVCNSHGRYNDDSGIWACTNDSPEPNNNQVNCGEKLKELIAQMR